MYISVIKYFNIVTATVTYELPGYPAQRMGTFVSNNTAVYGLLTV